MMKSLIVTLLLIQMAVLSRAQCECAPDSSLGKFSFVGKVIRMRETPTNFLYQVQINRYSGGVCALFDYDSVIIRTTLDCPLELDLNVNYFFKNPTYGRTLIKNLPVFEADSCSTITLFSTLSSSAKQQIISYADALAMDCGNQLGCTDHSDCDFFEYCSTEGNCEAQVGCYPFTEFGQSEDCDEGLYCGPFDVPDKAYSGSYICYDKPQEGNMCGFDSGTFQNVAPFCDDDPEKGLTCQIWGGPNDVPQPDSGLCLESCNTEKHGDDGCRNRYNCVEGINVCAPDNIACDTADDCWLSFCRGECGFSTSGYAIDGTFCNWTGCFK